MEYLVKMTHPFALIIRLLLYEVGNITLIRVNVIYCSSTRIPPLLSLFGSLMPSTVLNCVFCFVFFPGTTEIQKLQQPKGSLQFFPLLYWNKICIVVTNIVFFLTNCDDIDIRGNIKKILNKNYLLQWKKKN